MLQSGNNSSINEKYQENLIIFDTTLRDGEQSPGVTLMIDEKVCGKKSLQILHLMEIGSNCQGTV